MTGEEVKARLYAEGKTLSQWAKENGYAFSLVSNVVRGLSRNNYGKSHDIAVKLGMKPGTAKPSRPSKVAA